MPRLAGIVIPGQTRRVLQHGNNRQDDFFVDDDRRAYLEFLREHCARFGFNVPGYCLMSDHIHLVGTPALEDSLAKAIGSAHFRYNQYVDRLHRRSGHLWQSRFFLAAWMRLTCGGRCVTSSATRFGRRWYGSHGGARDRSRSFGVA